MFIEQGYLELPEAVVQRCSVKKVFLDNFIKKETLAQVLSCEFCEISKNTFFHRTHPAAASELLFISNSIWPYRDKTSKVVLSIHR